MSATGKKTEAVTIKGSASGLLIRLRDDLPVFFSEMLAELGERLQTGERFFRKGRAHVDLGGRVLELADLEGLKAVLERFEIELEAVISGANATRNFAKQIGVAYKLPTNQNTRPAIPRWDSGEGSQPEPATASRGPKPFDSAEALFIRRTLRSGQIIQHHADVVVLGDINPGAEIVAGGSVIVWGTVRGKIQAGVVERESVICALSLRPTQLGIGPVVAMAGVETINEPEHGPEIATVQDGTIVVESWTPRRGKLK